MGKADNQERERMPYVQIDTDLWAVLRESKEHPAAVISRITAVNGEPRFFLMTWHPNPAQRQMISMHETLAEANREVRWQVPTDNGVPPFEGYPPTMPDMRPRAMQETATRGGSAQGRPRAGA